MSIYYTTIYLKTDTHRPISATWHGFGGRRSRVGGIGRCTAYYPSLGRSIKADLIDRLTTLTYDCFVIYPSITSSVFMKLRIGKYHLHMSSGYLDVFVEVPSEETRQLIAEHRQTLARNPHDSTTHFLLGNVLRIDGQIALARQEYDQVVQTGDPQYAPLAATILADLVGRHDHAPPIHLKWCFGKQLLPVRPRPIPVQDPSARIALWQSLFTTDQIDWVIFAYGTCVVVEDKVPDVKHHAQDMLAGWGHVAPGTPLGDFSVSPLSSQPGWLVRYHHPTIFNHVHPSELPKRVRKKMTSTDDMARRELHAAVGMIGRQKRHNDSQSLQIVHVQLRHQ